MKAREWVIWLAALLVLTLGLAGQPALASTEHEDDTKGDCDDCKKAHGDCSSGSPMAAFYGQEKSVQTYLSVDFGGRTPVTLSSRHNSLNTDSGAEWIGILGRRRDLEPFGMRVKPMDEARTTIHVHYNSAHGLDFDYNAQAGKYYSSDTSFTSDYLQIVNENLDGTGAKDWIVLVKESGRRYYFHNATWQPHNHDGFLKAVKNAEGEKILSLGWTDVRLNSITEVRSGRTATFSYMNLSGYTDLAWKVTFSDADGQATERRTVYFGYDANKNLVRVVVSIPQPDNRSNTLLQAWEYVYDTESGAGSANLHNLLYVVGPDGWRRMIVDNMASVADLSLSQSATTSHPDGVTWSDYAEEQFTYGDGTTGPLDKVIAFKGAGCSGCGSSDGGYVYKHSTGTGGSFPNQQKNGGTKALYKFYDAYGSTAPAPTDWQNGACRYIEMNDYARTVYESTFVGGTESDKVQYVYDDDSRGRLIETIYNPGVNGREYKELRTYDQGKLWSYTLSLEDESANTRYLAYYEYEETAGSKAYGKLKKVIRYANSDRSADARNDRETNYTYYSSGNAEGLLQYVLHPKDYKGNGDRYQGSSDTTFVQRRTEYTYYSDAGDTSANYYLKVKEIKEQWSTDGASWTTYSTTCHEYYANDVDDWAFDGKLKKVTRDYGGRNLVTEYRYDAYGDLARVVTDPGTGELNLAVDTSWTIADDPDDGHATKYQLRKVTVKTGTEVDNAGTLGMDSDDYVLSETLEVPGGGGVVGQQKTKIDGGSEVAVGKSEMVYDAVGRLTSTKRYYGSGANDYCSEQTEYDKLGRVQYQVDGSDGGSEVRYNSRNLVDYRAWGPWDNGSLASINKTAEYTYLAAVPWVDYVADGADKVKTAYEYDAWGRVHYVKRYRKDDAQTPAYQCLSTTAYTYNNFDEVTQTKVWNRDENPSSPSTAADAWAMVDHRSDGRAFRRMTVDPADSSKRAVAEQHDYYVDNAGTKTRWSKALAIATVNGDDISSQEWGDGKAGTTVFDTAGRTLYSEDGKKNRTELTYDAAGRVTGRCSWALKPGEDGAQESDFEKSYVYSWHDYLGRATTVADYGVCAVAPSYSAASPPTDADGDAVTDARLVTEYVYGYGSDGMASPVDRLYTEVVAKNGDVETEPATRTYVDWLGRTVVVWENYGASAGDGDTRYTAYEYDNADRLTKIKAAYKYESGVWYTQDTDYTYDKRGRVTKATYPHSGTAASTDEVTTAWADERDEITSRTDQNGTQIDYAIVAKQLGGSGDWLLCVQEAVNAGYTVPPVGDQAMETYGDGLGRTVAVVTYGDEDFGAADETTRVGYDYTNGTQNRYNQLRYERQTLTSSQKGDYVVYGYDGYGRRTDLYYPDDSGSAPDSRHLVSTVDDLGRMTGLKVDQGSDFLVYSYLGYGLAEKKYPEPGANGHVLSLYNADASINGTDLFGRVTDQRIVEMDGSGDPQTADANRVVRIKYGYDDYSNRTYRKDELHPDGSQAYSYDRLHRLVESKQAKLDASGSPVGYRPILYDTDWTLSKLGNWDELQRMFRGGSASKDIRTHSQTNELTLRDMDDAVGSQVLIYEEFADEQDWAEADGSTWTVSDGKYYCQALDSGQGITLTGESDYHNMSLSVLLNWGENPGAGDQAGLVFAWQDDQNYWRCWFDRSDMRLRLVQISGGVAGSVTSGAAQGSAPSSLLVYINEGYVQVSNGGTVTRSAAVAAGKIGLYANNTTTRFDNVEVVDHRRDMAFRPGWTVDGGRTIWSGGAGYYTLSHTDTLTGTFSIRNSAVFRGCHMDDGRIEVRIAETSGSTTGGAIFRWQSPNDYWAVVAYNGDLRCIRVADGAESWVAIDDTNLPMTAEFWIQVTFSGQNLTVKHGTDGQNWTSTSISASAVLTGGTEDGYCGFGHYEPLRIEEYRILSADGSTTEFSDGFASDQKTLVHDPAGNLTFDGVYYYEYDYKNRLGRVTRCGSADGAADFEASGLVKSASASKLGSVIATYTYDGLNRRLRKVVGGCGSLDQDTRFYYSGWRCVEERAVTDAAPATWAERPWKRYTWGGRYLDELVRYEADTTADGSVDKDYYVHQDALYNVVAVVAHGGADDGAVVERVEYDPYGRARLFDKNNTPLAASAVGLDYLFTGQRRDSETGLYYFKNRYYDADTGRFTARDPVGYRSGLSLLQYVASHPTASSDPLGLWEETWSLQSHSETLVKKGWPYPVGGIRFLTVSTMPERRWMLSVWSRDDDWQVVDIYYVRRKDGECCTDWVVEESFIRTKTMEYDVTTPQRAVVTWGVGATITFSVPTPVIVSYIIGTMGGLPPPTITWVIPIPARVPRWISGTQTFSTEEEVARTDGPKTVSRQIMHKPYACGGTTPTSSMP